MATAERAETREGTEGWEPRAPCASLHHVALVTDDMRKPSPSTATSSAARS